MLSIRDIYDSPKNFQAILLWFILLPFWYVDIYLFSPWIINQNDYLLKISICFICNLFSVCLLLFCVLCSFSSRKIKTTLNEMSGVTIIILSCWSAILSIACFLWSILSNKIITFYGFIGIYFLPLIFTFLFYFFKNNNYKKHIEIET